MNNLKLRLTLILTLTLATAGSAFAAKPESPGNANPKKSSQLPSAGASAGDAVADVFFNDARRAILSDYYATSRKSGHCPPGLAKKNNGCLPPGQAKKWHRGEYLPHDAVYHDLPAVLIHELGRTPEGAKVIQVGAGLLLINAATGMILDAMDIPE